jgi:hypothetical protein
LASLLSFDVSIARWRALLYVRHLTNPSIGRHEFALAAGLFFAGWPESKI